MQAQKEAQARLFSLRLLLARKYDCLTLSSGSTLPPSVDTSLQLFSHLPSGLSWGDTSYVVPPCCVFVLFTGPRLRGFQSSTDLIIQPGSADCGSGLHVACLLVQGATALHERRLDSLQDRFLRKLLQISFHRHLQRQKEELRTRQPGDDDHLRSAAACPIHFGRCL